METGELHIEDRRGGSPRFRSESYIPRAFGFRIAGGRPPRLFPDRLHRVQEHGGRFWEAQAGRNVLRGQRRRFLRYAQPPQRQLSPRGTVVFPGPRWDRPRRRFFSGPSPRARVVAARAAGRLLRDLHVRTRQRLRPRRPERPVRRHGGGRGTPRARPRTPAPAPRAALTSPGPRPTGVRPVLAGGSHPRGVVADSPPAPLPGAVGRRPAAVQPPARGDHCLGRQGPSGHRRL